MNVDRTPVEVPAAGDYYAGDWVDQLDELKINIDERQVVANAGAYALGRKTDELIIAALDRPRQIAGGGSDGLTKAKVLDAFECWARRTCPTTASATRWSAGSSGRSCSRSPSSRAPTTSGRTSCRGAAPRPSAGSARCGCRIPAWRHGRRPPLLLVSQERDWSCHRPGGHDRHHLARRPRRALRRPT